MKANLHRRNFLKKTSLGLGVGVGLGTTLYPAISQALGESCKMTPPQTRGPFYPGEAEFTSDQDLTRVPGSSQRATGQVVYIRGKVLDTNCSPIQGANVEIWQACESGSYNHDHDPNPAPRDPNFKYWAEAFTAKNGEYWFKTIIPGAYPASSDWERPPHIHFRIACLGYHELITQMYFKGNPLNGRDRILQSLSPAERSSVEIAFLKPSPFLGLEPGSLLGFFDITLKSV